MPPGEGGSTDPPTFHTITISESARDAHLALGDVEGQCPTPPELKIFFDNISLAGEVVALPIPNGYKGFVWNNWNYIHRQFNPLAPGYRCGTVSGNYTSYNPTSQANLSRGTPFSVFRLFAQFLISAGGDTITFDGFDDQNVVKFSKTHVLGSIDCGPYLLELNFTGIYKFRSQRNITVTQIPYNESLNMVLFVTPHSRCLPLSPPIIFSYPLDPICSNVQ